jgi:hypothetical protein
MTSCGGTFSVSVRKSTRTIFSRKGMMKLSPGPRKETRRPKRKTTPRSYSLKTLSPVRTTPRRMTKKMIIESNNLLPALMTAIANRAGTIGILGTLGLKAAKNLDQNNGLVVLSHLASIDRVLQPRVRPKSYFPIESSYVGGSRAECKPMNCRKSKCYDSRQQNSKQKPRGLSLRAYSAILTSTNRPHSKVRLTHPRSKLDRALKRWSPSGYRSCILNKPLAVGGDYGNL